jgi:hypothetical protein
MAFAQNSVGQVLDSKDNPIEYAHSRSAASRKTIAAAITDTSGYFTLSATEGIYD